jgi:carboxylate-amine ligase
MRACDGVSTATELGALAAVIHCLVERMSTQLDEGEAPLVLQPWFVRENKWRAARYGIDADIIVDPGGAQGSVADGIRALVTELAPVAERLGCENELADVERILDRGVSYQRQLAVADANGGSLPAVVSSLTRELRNGHD